MKPPASPSIAFPPAGTGRRYGPGRDFGVLHRHAPGAQEARRKGGHATSGTERAGELLPARLQPVVSILEGALGEVHRGELDPRAASAMDSLAGALVRAITAGELEERSRALEARGARATGGKTSP